MHGPAPALLRDTRLILSRAEARQREAWRYLADIGALLGQAEGIARTIVRRETAPIPRTGAISRNSSSIVSDGRPSGKRSNSAFATFSILVGFLGDESFLMVTRVVEEFGLPDDSRVGLKTG